MLKRAGYSDIEVATAFSRYYDNEMLFVDKPADADLEGYIFGETYQFNDGVAADKVIERALDELYLEIVDNNLIEKFASHGLNLYQGITLASIVEREVNNEQDQKNVAQVFYNRLSWGMTLGSDVTYQYAADKLGIARDVNLDSPYNTRIYSGLPPGPICSPGLSALIAVAEPTSNDYLYFLSGDDDTTYFAADEYGHNMNIANHCIVKCSTP
jgi:UPF0755 protein